MAPACWVCDGEGSEKGQWPMPAFLSVRKLCQVRALMPDTSVPPCMPLVPFKLLPWCWSSEGVSLSMRPCVGSLKGTAWDSRSFFQHLNSHCFFQPEVMGTNFSGTGTLGSGVWCGTVTPHSQDIPAEFLSTTYGYGTIPFHISAPPTSLDRCSFFSSVFVRLPFNSISDVSE